MSSSPFAQKSCWPGSVGSAVRRPDRPRAARPFRTPALLLLGAITLGATACEAAPVEPNGTTILGMSPFEWGAGLSLARISNGGPDWSTVNGELLLRSDPADSLRTNRRRVVALDLQRAERFGQQDSQVGATAAIPFGRRWTAAVEADGSPSNRFLPVWAADIGLSRELGAGVVVTGRVRHREYRATPVDGAALALEKYAGIFRAEYEFSASAVRGAGATPSHHVVADAFYGADPRDRVRLAFAFGKEIEGVAAYGVTTSSVRDGSVSWQQRLSERWAIESGLSLSDHHPLYTRREVQLGLRCAL